MDFRQFLHSRPIVLDAGMGTRLIAQGLDLRQTDPSDWNLEAPEIVANIHERDHRAGADAVFTNSFGIHSSNRPVPVQDELNRAAVRLARQVVGTSGFVVASLGPRPSWGPADFRQVDTLMESGADALVMETSGPCDAIAALESIRNRTHLPLIVSLFARPGREVWGRLQGLGADVVGVNCLSDFALINSILEDASETVDLPLIVKPSGGLPQETPTHPSTFTAAVPDWIARGVRLIGGCCGTSEQHVAGIRQGLDAISTRFRPDNPREIR